MSASNSKSAKKIECLFKHVIATKSLKEFRIQLKSISLAYQNLDLISCALDPLLIPSGYLQSIERFINIYHYSDRGDGC